MSLKKWLHRVNEKQFGYRSFLINLAKKGKEDIITPDTDTGITLVTTLYLDADMILTIQIPDDEATDVSDLREEHINKHLASVSEKIDHITRFFNHSVALAGFLGFAAPWLVNYSPLLFDYQELLGQAYSLISSSVISTGVVIFRKKVAPFIMKQIAGKIFSIRFKGVSFNTNFSTSEG